MTKGGAGGSTFDTPGGAGGGVIRIVADIVNVDGKKSTVIFDIRINIDFVLHDNVIIAFSVL